MWVAHCSVLGPLLFLIYMNDFCKCLDYAKLIIFADDSTTLLTHDNLSELHKMMAIDLENLTSGFKANRLVLDIDKAKFVLFHNKKDVAIKWKLKIGTPKIERKKTSKFLGVIIDECLQWKDHID